MDLGSLHVPREGELDLTESDGMFVAGEWVAMVGTGLNTDQWHPGSDMNLEL